MKYIETIFENQNVQALITENEDLFNIATSSLINYNAFLEAFISSNLESYLTEGELVDTYSNITGEVINENVAFMQNCVSVIRSELKNEEKAAILELFSVPELYLDFVSEVGATARTYYPSNLAFADGIARTYKARYPSNLGSFADGIKTGTKAAAERFAAWLKGVASRADDSMTRLGGKTVDRALGSISNSNLRNNLKKDAGRSFKGETKHGNTAMLPGNLDKANRVNKWTGRGIVGAGTLAGTLAGAGAINSVLDKDK